MVDSRPFLPFGTLFCRDFVVLALSLEGDKKTCVGDGKKKVS